MDINKIYDEYIEYCEESDVPQSSRLTLEEFTGKEEVSEERITLGFVSPSANTAAGIAMGGVLKDVLKNPVKFAYHAADTVGAARAYVGRLRQAGDTIVKIGNDFKRPGTPGSSTPGGSGGGGGSSNDGGSSNFNLGTMNLNPTPLNVTLDTGIIPNTFGKYFLDSNPATACMHVTNVELKIPINSGDLKFESWWNTVVAFNLQTTMQRRLSFNMNLQAVSATKLASYFNAVLDALQLWYFHASIISYTNNPHNHNEGMHVLRGYMSANDLDDLYRLQRILAGFPIPPNMNNLCQFLGSNFKESMNPGAGLLKTMPTTWGTASGSYFLGYDGSSISGAISNLETDDNRYIASILAKAFPSWVKVNITVPSDIPLCSPNFNTFFANLPFLTSSTSGPRITDENQLIFYGSYADRLDGSIFGLMTAFQTDVNRWVPSLLSPVVSFVSTTTPSNRFSYFDDGTNAGFYASSEFTKLAYSRGESYTLVGSVPHEFRKFGMEEMLQVTASTVRETSYKLLEWMIMYDDSDTSTTKGSELIDTDANDGYRSNNKNRRRRR